MDDRWRQFAAEGQFVPTPDEEFSLSVVFEPGRRGPEGWPDGYLWHLECSAGTLCHYRDLGGNPFCRPDDWLLPLTGCVREEFLVEHCQDEIARYVAYQREVG